MAEGKTYYDTLAKIAEMAEGLPETALRAAKIFKFKCFVCEAMFQVKSTKAVTTQFLHSHRRICPTCSKASNSDPTLRQVIQLKAKAKERWLQGKV